MKLTPRARSFAALLVMICLLVAPMTAVAKKGEKNYKRGLQYEIAQQWERAAQEFALAVAASPGNVEYQLHYRRAIFNASQLYMQQGRTLAEQGDYTGAYNAFRQAYGLDPINELAASEMERMLRLQREKNGGDGNGSNGTKSTNSNGSGVRIAPTSFQPPGTPRSAQQEPVLPTRSEQLRVINYSGDLESFIRNLADQLNLNVVFDRDFPKGKSISINWRDVTTAKALDLIFISQGLFFQRLDRRTILIADQNKRPIYQQLVIRTFYLSNMKPNDARGFIQAALLPQAGRQVQAIPNDATNSITVRDTAENVRLIGELLQTIDKDRSEVVMDVNIYEVSRTDLLQLGNQIGNDSTLGNLGGVQRQTAVLGGAREVALQGLGVAAPPTALGAALLLPTATLSAFQSRNRSRLLASTQVHAFDGDQSITRIGQKVPVQTAQVSPFGSFGGVGTQTGTNPQQGGFNAGYFGGGYPVIQYQDTGLILEFTPTVYPNLDVQVKMKIESSDAIFSGSGQNLTPTFSQRNVTGTARIPNNRTMMIASIAQNRESNGRQGLPVLGLIPVLGRLFSTPRQDNSQSDIVITVTPRIIRAPTITPSDEVTRPSGSMQSPTMESLEAMLQQVDREDQLAAARQLPTNVSMRLPDADPEPPAYVPAPKAMMNAANAPSTGTTGGAAALAVSNTSSDRPSAVPALSLNIKGAATQMREVVGSARDLDHFTPYAITLPSMNKTPAEPVATVPKKGATELFLVSNQPEMRVGERQRLALALKTEATLNLAAVAVRFDPRVLAVRTVSSGNMFTGALAGLPTITQAVDPKGTLLVSIIPASGAPPLTGTGVLLFIEVEALAAGNSALGLDKDAVHLIASDGHNIITQLSQSPLMVRQ